MTLPPEYFHVVNSEDGLYIIYYILYITYYILYIVYSIKYYILYILY